MLLGCHKRTSYLENFNNTCYDILFPLDGSISPGSPMWRFACRGVSHTRARARTHTVKFYKTDISLSIFIFITCLILWMQDIYLTSHVFITLNILAHSPLLDYCWLCLFVCLQVLMPTHLLGYLFFWKLEWGSQQDCLPASIGRKHVIWFSSCE